MKIFKNYSLSNFQTQYSINCNHRAVHDIPLTYLSYNWKFVPLTLFTDFIHHSLPLETTYLFSVSEFVCLFTIPHISEILKRLSLSVYLHNINLYIWICLYCCCSVTQSCPTLCDPMDCSMPGFPVLHHLLQFAQIHVHWVGGTIQPSHPLLSPSPAFNFSHHLFQWVSSSHQMAKVLELQLQHQSFQWICKVNFI